MTLRDLMAADMARFTDADEFGSTVTYITPDGTETELECVLFGERTETPEVEGITTKLRIQKCTWAAADLSPVNLRATMDISGVEWAIAGVEYADNQQITVRLERRELMEHTRPNYRRRSGGRG